MYYDDLANKMPKAGITSGNHTFSVGSGIDIFTNDEGGNIQIRPNSSSSSSTFEIDGAGGNLRFICFNSGGTNIINWNGTGDINLNNLWQQAQLITNFINADGSTPMYSGDLNDITTTSFYNTYNNGGSSHGPSGKSWGFVMTFIHPSAPADHRSQIFVAMADNSTDGLYYRHKEGTNWTDWKSVPKCSVSGSTLTMTI